VVLVYNDIELRDEQPSIPPPFSHNPTTPQWRHSGNYRFQTRLHVSTLNDEAVSFVLPSRDEIYKLTIPHNPDVDPYLVGPISAHQSATRSSTGFEKALFREGQDSLVKLGFSWGSTMKKPTKQALIVSPDLRGILRFAENYPIQTFLVEETGRIILHPRNMIYILDTSVFRTWIE
ncbi:hypothetical protein C0993_010224, partial [Termitomyces sp. T159_Od127]